jgi:high affinity choline transporter 7
MRVAIICVGALATVMALTINSIYGLWYLCADLVYVILFPQLLCVVYMSKSNTYGSLSAYIGSFLLFSSFLTELLEVGLILRLSGGEPLLHFPAFIHFPMYTDGVQYFPFRTLAMACSLTTIISVSLTTEYLFKSGRVPIEWDFLTCVVNISPERLVLPNSASFSASCDTLAMHKIRSENGISNAALSTSGEQAALHPNSAERRDYSSLQRH